MSVRKIPPSTPLCGLSRVAWLREGVLEMTLHGRVTVDDIEEGIRQISVLTEHARLDSVLIDANEVDSYTAHVGSPAERLVTLVRKRGAREVVFVVSSDAGRMITASVAFAVQLPLKIYATRAEALAYLRV